MSSILFFISHIAYFFFYLALLLWFCTVLLFETYSSVPSICLSVYFCVLRRSATSPDIKGIGLLKKIPGCPIVQYALFTRTRCSRGISYWVVYGLLLWLSRVCLSSSQLHSPTFPAMVMPDRVWPQSYWKVYMMPPQPYWWVVSAIRLAVYIYFTVAVGILKGRMLSLNCPLRGFLWWQGPGVRLDVSTQSFWCYSVCTYCQSYLCMAS